MYVVYYIELYKAGFVVHVAGSHFIYAIRNIVVPLRTYIKQEHTVMEESVKRISV